MKKKKVIEYIWTLNDGGAETLVKDYALLLDKNKFEVIVLTNVINKETANLRVLKENNIRIISIYKKWNLFSKIAYIFFNDYVIKRKLKQIIKAEKPDCIHAHLAVLKYLDSIKNELKGIKLIYTCHSNPAKVFMDDSKAIEKEAALDLVKNNQLLFVALHSQMKDELNSIFDVDNTVVIRNGINCCRFSNCPTKEECRIKIGITENSFVLGHIGRFSKVKNHKLIIDVFQGLKKIQDNSFLLLVGDGEEKTEITQYIQDIGLSDSVMILSNRTDVPELLRCMDCFIFPSLYEGLGIAIIEAQISGLPCVVSNHIPKEAFVSNSYQVLSLESSTINDWVHAILNPINNAEIVIDKSEYDLNRGIKRLEELY